MENAIIIGGVLIAIMSTVMAIVTFRKTIRVFPRILVVLGAAFGWIGMALTIILTNTSVQTKVVMTGFERVEPLATIIATDPQMKEKIRQTVEKTIKEHGPKTEPIKEEVTKVLKPYMAYRLQHAPDRYVIRSANNTLDVLTKAKADGPQNCAKIMRGDFETVQKYGGLSQDWLPEMLKEESLDQPREASTDDLQKFIAEIWMKEGWQTVDILNKDSPDSPLICDYPIKTISAAVQLPEDQAAAMLRRLGYGKGS